VDVGGSLLPDTFPSSFQAHQWQNCPGITLSCVTQCFDLLSSLSYLLLKITGAGHGIGRELAHQFSQLGCVIVCWDINLEAAQETASEVKQSGGQAYAFHCDVSDQQDVETTAQKVKNTVSHIDIIINNAGIMPCHPLLSHSVQEIDRCIDINVKGCIWVSISSFLAI